MSINGLIVPSTNFVACFLSAYYNIQGPHPPETNYKSRIHTEFDTYILYSAPLLLFSSESRNPSNVLGIRLSEEMRIASCSGKRIHASGCYLFPIQKMAVGHWVDTDLIRIKKCWTGSY